MKTTSITPHEAARIINCQFADDELVYVSASQLYDDELGNPETQFTVDIVPYRIGRGADAEWAQRNAMLAAVLVAEAGICFHTFIQQIDEIGWVDSEHGSGKAYLVTVK